MTLTQLALKIALSQNGIQEIPRNSNSGPAVEKYLKSVGLGKGFAWCMAFIYWSFKTASLQLDVLNPLYKTGGVLDMWNHLKDSRVTTPQPGDIGILDFGGGKGHAFIVIAVFENGLILSIEGNTNDDGSREGYEVAVRHDRKTSKCLGFLRLK